MRGRHADRLAKTELVQFRSRRRRRVVELVGDQQAGHSLAAHLVGDGKIVAQRARAAVDQKEDYVGGRQSSPHLLTNAGRIRRFVAGVEAPRVYESQGAARPVGLHLLAIPRHARSSVHDGAARAAEAVYQCGFAGVRRADNDDDGKVIHKGSIPNASSRDDARLR